MTEARKVYGSLNSPATLKVLALLFELDVRFEFVAIDLDAGEHKKKPFLSMSVSSNNYLKIYDLSNFCLSRF